MINLRFDVDIQASADRVFSILADLRHYDRWLPKSSAFHGTNEISGGPIAIGTTYTEPGPLGIRHGRVTEFDPPVRLSFEQPMTMRPQSLGVIGIRLSHILTPKGSGVHLCRTLELAPSGPVKLAMPLVIVAFRVENKRMMKILKAFAESGA
jgi:uncharacterized protein YndB with AHSA1/START domain